MCLRRVWRGENGWENRKRVFTFDRDAVVGVSSCWSCGCEASGGDE